jgi:arginase
MNRGLAALQRARRITAVEVACGEGARDKRCREGPAAFRRESTAPLCSNGIALTWRLTPEGLCSDDVAPLKAISRVARWTTGVTRRLAADGDRFIVIGGDHSCSIGTWSGVSDAMRERGPLGLVWIDAHMDMHTPETSHSGAINGMPIACLLGYGAPELTEIAETGPAIDPRHVCLVGARSFEPEEVAFAERLGVHVIGMEDIRRHGIGAALSEAQQIASNGTAGFGVSLDLDAFDPVDTPGVGTPAPDGVRVSGFLAPWRKLIGDQRCLAIEIAEYNPWRDQSGRTARVMRDLISAWV